MIFSISYGLSQGGVYPKLPVQSEPVVVDALLPAASPTAGEELLLTVTVSPVVDLRGFSLRLAVDESTFEYIGIEPGDLLAAVKEHPVFLKARQLPGEIQIDGAVVGQEAPGLNGEGSLVRVHLRCKSSDPGELGFGQVELRNSRNQTLESRIGQGLLSAMLPTEFALSPNYPNPFNPVTTIRYQLPEDGRVCLRIYNSLGQLVRELVNADKKAGYYQVQWDGRNNQGIQVTSGIYFYRIEAGSFTQTRKMILMK